MNPYGISEKTYQLLLETFDQFSEINAVLIFGSRAKGDYRNGSDIDLAVKGEDMNPSLVFKLKNLFNERLPIPYKVDVVSFDNLTHKALKDHITRRGKLIFSK
ncbi:MAG TPA: nucleotidyltransferase domain-containing protein [Balneolaceae bacterium]|nr:nucleotidyltransferase domain-containing protein [Balneolaceae bacterium]